MLDKTLLEILACPACKTGVVETGDYVVCSKCGRRFPVRDSIPIMLLDEAVPVDCPSAGS